MEYAVQTQTLEFLRAGLLGLTLGLHYDLLRIPRVLLPKLTWLIDLWFCITMLVSMLAFALYCGAGQLHLFMLAGLFLGLLLYFLCPGRLLGALATQLGKKIKIFFQKLFSKLKKSGKIVSEK